MALDPKYFFELNMEFGLLSKLRPTEGATCLWDSRWKPAERRQARAGAHSSPHAALPDNFKKDWRPLPRRCCKVLWVENQPRVSAHGIRSHSTGRARGYKLQWLSRKPPAAPGVLASPLLSREDVGVCPWKTAGMRPVFLAGSGGTV